MIPLDTAVNILSVLIAAMGGAWIGSSKCHVAFEIDSAEHRKATWLDKLCPCLPKKKSWRSDTTKSLQ